MGSIPLSSPYLDERDEELVLEVDADGGTDEQTWTVMQVGVPARDFWKDIYFT